MKSPPVSIVIITTGQFKFIGECITSVLSSNYKNLHIYLIDNNSDEEQYSAFYNRYKKVKKITFFRSNKNLGFAGACNYFLKKIKSGYVVLLNDDTIVSKNWLRPIIRYMEQNPNVGACQPKIKSMRKKSYFEYAGAGGGFMDVYGYPFCRGRIFYTLEKDYGQYDDIVDVVWTSGNCLITKIDVLKKVGLLDEVFFIYGEEADLCWRMHFNGYRLVYIPSSVVYHYGSGTMGSTSRKVFLHHRNGLILLLKNYTVAELFKYLPFRVFLDFVAFWYYLLDSKLPLNALAVLKAYVNLIYLIPVIITRRRYAAFKIYRTDSSNYPLYKRSIIKDYFIHKKKKFSQLNITRKAQTGLFAQLVRS